MICRWISGGGIAVAGGIPVGGMAVRTIAAIGRGSVAGRIAAGRMVFVRRTAAAGSAAVVASGAAVAVLLGLIGIRRSITASAAFPFSHIMSQCRDFF